MAMEAGTVSISGAGIASGTGAAKFLYDELIQDYSNPLLAQKQQVASFCNRIAKIITYIENNAQVTTTISTSAGGLQRVGGVDTDPPGTQKTLPGTIT